MPPDPDWPRLIEIPDACLVVLVGPAGSGKSTFAARHFAPDEVLSSDAFRARIASDQRDQRATRPAFAALHATLVRRLRAGRLAVVDATNVTTAARRALTGRAAAAGMPAIAIVLDLPLPEVLARNGARRYVVPEPAVLAQAAELRRAMEPGGLEADGFTRVVRLRSAAEVDAVRVTRAPATLDPLP